MDHGSAYRPCGIPGALSVLCHGLTDGPDDRMRVIINTYLLRWIMRKYKKHSTWKKAIKVLAEAAANRPRHLAHWAWLKPATR